MRFSCSASLRVVFMEEGSRDVGVGARGSCQGGGITPILTFPRQGGRDPRPAPLPWIPAFAGKTRGGAWETDAVGGGGPFDRLRANGPSPLPLWIPAFAGMTMGEQGQRAGAGDSGEGIPAPRPCPGFPLSREGREGGAWETDAVGGGGPFDRLRANGPSPLPLWIPAFAGMTMGEQGQRAGAGDSGEGIPAPRPCPGFPLSRERREGERGKRTLLVVAGPSTGSMRTAPRLCPSGFLPSQE